MSNPPATAISRGGGRPREGEQPRTPFARWLRRYRGKVKDLATRLDVTTSYVYDLRAGRRVPSEAMRARLVRTLRDARWRDVKSWPRAGDDA